MISQVIHLPQPKVISNVVAIHKRLQKQQEHNGIIIDRLVDPQVDIIYHEHVVFQNETQNKTTQ